MSVYITIEAPRGAGKSFIARLIEQRLSELGYDVYTRNVDEIYFPPIIKGLGKILIKEKGLS